MARGFESKSVADQQEARQARSRVRGGHRPRRAEDAWQLARADVEQRLQTATSGPHREMLQRALKAIEEQAAEEVGGAVAAGRRHGNVETCPPGSSCSSPTTA